MLLRADDNGYVPLVLETPYELLEPNFVDHSCFLAKSWQINPPLPTS